MLKKQQISENIIRYYSDNNKYIRRVEDGSFYKERFDVINGKWTYEETDIDIEQQNTNQEEK